MPVIGIAEVLVQPVFTGMQRKIEREIGPVAQKAGRDAGASMGAGMSDGFSAGAEGVRNDMRKVGDESDRTGERVGRLGNLLNSAFRGSPLSSMVTSMRRDTDRATNDFSRFAGSLTSLGSKSGRNVLIATSAISAGLATITPAAGAAGAGLIAASGNALALASSLSSLAGIAALVPAGLMSIGAGAGVLVTAFAGVGEAMKTALDASSAIAGPGGIAANPRLAAMAVEDAMMAITVAEENAAEAQENSARRVADAKRALMDVVTANAEAQQAAAKAVVMAERDEAKAARDLLEAQKDLDEAKKLPVSTANTEKLLKAEQRLADAQVQQGDAIQNRKDAQADAVKQEQEGARRVADAQQAITDATKAAERAQVDATRAVEQAHRNLERVQMQQADAAASSAAAAAKAGDKSAEAMGKLTPAAQEAVRALLQVKDQLTGIRRIAQENFFTGFAAPLLSLSRSVMPQLAIGVGAIALALGAGAQTFMGSLERALGGGVLESLLMGVAKSTDILNKAIDPVVQSFTTLGVVGMEYMPRLAQFITDMADRFNGFIQTAAADGSLNRWIDEGIQGLKDLWSIAGSVHGIFEAINRAAESAGIVATLGGMAEALRNVEAVMQGPVFQTTMATIFQGAEAGAAGLLAALGPIGAAFERGAPAMAEFLRLGGEIAGTFLGGVFTALSDPAFGAGLVTFMEGLQKGVEATAPHLPGMAAAFGELLTALAPIAAVIGPALVQVLTFMADGLANVIEFLSPLLVLIAGSPVAMGILIGVFAAAVIAAGLFTAAMAIQRIVVIGAWALMSAQALFHGARMALAWVIALGPIAWVIAAVLGLAALIILNWDKISAVTKAMWEHHVKPHLDAFHKFIHETLPAAFVFGVGLIKKEWDKLQELAKVPVKFVIQKVINEGLIDGLNGVGKLMGLAPLEHAKLPAGFAEGGYTGDGGKYQPAGIVHAGEFVFTKEQTAKAGVGNLYAMARALAGYAKGGLVHPVPASTVSQPFHGGHNGIDFAAPTGTPIVAAGPGRVSMAGWSAGGGGNEIHIDHPNGLQTWYAHLSRFAVQAGEMVRAGQRIGDVGSTGNSTGPHLHYMVLNGGWPNYTNPGAYLDGGGEAGKGGWNPIAGIVDGLVNSFKAAFPAAGFIADLAIGAGKKLLDGAVGFVMGNGGKDNIGSAGLPYLHDQGGVLPPGLSQVVNRTRKPEYILNPQQWSDIHKLATRDNGARAGVNFHGPIHVRDENELARIIQTRQMDAMAVYR